MKKTIWSIIFFVLLISFVACDDDEKPNQPPLLVISVDPTTGTAPLAVQFTANGEDPENKPLTYSWNFGDGSAVSAEQNPAHTYSVAGEYTATCTVSDSGSPSLTASATAVITVYQSKIPTLGSISPSWSVVHMPAFTMTVTGTDFFPNSKIIFAGKEMDTTYISATQLSCRIRPDDTVLSAFLRSDGSFDLESDQYAGVLVRNSGTGGGDSATVQFTIRPNHIFASPALVSTSSDKTVWSSMALHKAKYLYVTYADSSAASDWYENEFIRTSKDSGQTWGNAHMIPWTDEQWKNMVAAGNDGVLYFQQDENLYRSYDDGETLTGPTLISVGTPDESCHEYWNQDYSLKMLSNGKLYSAWMESRYEICIPDCNYEQGWILHLSSNDGGSTWSSPEKIPTHVDMGANYYYPSLWVTPSGKLHYFYASGCCDPQFATGYAHMISADNAQSWSTAVDVLSLTVYFIIPTVGDDDGLYIPNRTEGASSQQINVKYWIDGAAAPSATSNAVSISNSQTVRSIAVCVDSIGNINLFYTYGPNDSGYAVYYQRSFDRGVTWTTSQKISYLGYITAPNSILCDTAGNLYLIWSKTSSPYPIYFTSSDRNQ